MQCLRIFMSLGSTYIFPHNSHMWDFLDFSPHELMSFFYSKWYFPLDCPGKNSSHKWLFLCFENVEFISWNLWLFKHVSRCPSNATFETHYSSMNFRFDLCLLKSELYPNNLLQALHWKFWRLSYESFGFSVGISKFFIGFILLIMPSNVLPLHLKQTVWYYP